MRQCKKTKQKNNNKKGEKKDTLIEQQKCVQIGSTLFIQYFF